MKPIRLTKVTGNHSIIYRAKLIRRLALAIFMPLFMLTFQTQAQTRVKAPVKFKIEDGDFSGATVVLKNNTTNESHSIPGSAKFDLDLKINSDYTISFSKPGYITKKIAFNTSAPADRSSQGYYPFLFEVNLFKQYDGVNIVIFNQPVGKIEYSRFIDDFDYDTDYTKQIQSALKLAEEEIIKKQKEELALAEQQKKDEAQRKADEAAQARVDLKAKQAADKKAAEEARQQAIADARQKKLEEEQRQLQAKANLEEEKRLKAIAKIEEEERAKLKAAEDEEARRLANAGTGNDSRVTSGRGVVGDDQRARASSGSGNDQMPSSSTNDSENSSPSGNILKGDGSDDLRKTEAEAIKKQDPGIIRATGHVGYDTKPSAQSKLIDQASSVNVLNEQFEVLPAISVEEIVESNRKITKVIVRKGQKETIFSKINYDWGGIYYFRSNTSISESLFFSNTGLR